MYHGSPTAGMYDDYSTVGNFGRIFNLVILQIQ